MVSSFFWDRSIFTWYFLRVALTPRACPFGSLNPTPEFVIKVMPLWLGWNSSISIAVYNFWSSLQLYMPPRVLHCVCVTYQLAKDRSWWRPPWHGGGAAWGQEVLPHSWGGIWSWSGDHSSGGGHPASHRWVWRHWAVRGEIETRKLHFIASAVLKVQWMNWLVFLSGGISGLRFN